MKTRKFFQVSMLVGFTLAMFLTLTIGATQMIQAAPPFQAPLLYEDIYKILDDGTIVATRVEISPEQIRSTAACTQSAPTLLEPANTSQIDTLIPDYVWEQVSNDVFCYKLEVSEFSDFSSLDNSAQFHTSSPSAGNPFTAFSRSNLSPDTTYYWRVASRCEGTYEYGPFSSPFSFQSAPAGGDILDAPSMLSPDDGVTVGSTRVTFSLGDVSGATKYQYRFFDDASADWDDWFSWSQRNEPIATRTFDPQETIYWRTAAVNDYAIGTPSVLRSFTTPSVMTSTQITPDNGGTLIPDPGNISIVFPPNAVTAQTTLSYTLQPQPSQDLANFRFAGRAFTLNAFDTSGEVTTFNQPFTISIQYDTFDLLAAGIGDPSQLNLIFWNGSEWEEILPCTGCAVDTINQTVTVVLNHLTEFALIARNETKIYLPIVLK